MPSTVSPYPDRRSWRSRFLRRVTKPEATLAEWWSGCVAVMWGMWLMNPWADPFATAPVYRSMAALAPSWTWGLIVSMIGVSQLRSLWTGGYEWQRGAFFAACVAWLFVGLCMLASSPSNTGAPVYVSLSLLQAAIYWRLKVDLIRSIQSGSTPPLSGL